MNYVLKLKYLQLTKRQMFLIITVNYWIKKTAGALIQLNTPAQKQYSLN